MVYNNNDITNILVIILTISIFFINIAIFFSLIAATLPKKLFIINNNVLKSINKRLKNNINLKKKKNTYDVVLIIIIATKISIENTLLN